MTRNDFFPINNQFKLPVNLFRSFTIINSTLQEATLTLARALKTPKRYSRSPLSVAFLNMHNYNVVCDNEAALTAFSEIDHLYADGVSLQLARYILQLPRFERLSGTDVITNLLANHIPLHCKVFLLGGSPSSCASLHQNFSLIFPRAMLAGIHHGYFSNLENKNVIETINASGAELLLVGMGAPTQELWLQSNKHKLKVSAAVCVGGLFHYWDRSLMRAPRFMQAIGLEWLYILIQQPHKWPNYSIGAWRFFARLLSLTFSTRK
ncbi:MAG: WecB/TagA/CpsF family glycosyltransferase [Nitrosomonas sp.]|uniref:WecB/TagA/CpsF family glycosyltransferase n=1 Tax=Nitrosomonas sp. TaxID=42353 RepID=UPI0027545CA2|nr:WecB/TagA/CpsF family glycosyltransferase [Nitrosomonas sp.]MDP3184555.1 WecB/TagA/CpsF family glycosyltransferase [Anaerolineales bacterium]MDP3609341.1 WecB/TagA/CpsF family glycosyltransferase [Methylophilus sp.]MDZ4106378.1 WecB/TagA/CpsF family glycosyltransferase [Nitrosomonas sp.]